MTTPQDSARPLSKSVFNVPNQLTAMRLLLAVVMFALVGLEYYMAGFVLFLIAATTDWLDGYWARKYGQITVLGRILDPFADKVIICGSFVFLVVAPGMIAMPWGLRAWMVVVVIAREMLVTMLRGLIEREGGDFSARWSGKWKMILQCVAVGASLFCLSYAGTETAVPDWCRWVMIGSIWSAVALTIYSGVIYIVAAIRIMRPESEPRP
ncbi:MAG TPA: CDP-diacylglycerol--glycerol-3-phosphate 3-phosphatidyltransferase [Thermoguttaceae bacterium]|nr:CDP-diacylglycerol--glycerol-3-phosphate 3-phosphatidyltransferase [Thermoguttaceae bacterium]